MIQQWSEDAYDAADAARDREKDRRVQHDAGNHVACPSYEPCSGYEYGSPCPLPLAECEAQHRDEGACAMAYSDEHEQRVEIPQARELGLANRGGYEPPRIETLTPRTRCDDYPDCDCDGTCSCQYCMLACHARCELCGEPATVTTADGRALCARDDEARVR